MKGVHQQLTRILMLNPLISEMLVSVALIDYMKLVTTCLLCQYNGSTMFAIFHDLS